MEQEVPPVAAQCMLADTQVGCPTSITVPSSMMLRWPRIRRRKHEPFQSPKLCNKQCLRKLFHIFLVVGGHWRKSSSGVHKKYLTNIKIVNDHSDSCVPDKVQCLIQRCIKRWMRWMPLCYFFHSCANSWAVHAKSTVVLTFGLYLVLGLYTTKDC